MGCGMDVVSVFLLAPALSMDAFAASLCLGLAVEKVRMRHRLKAGVYFGLFQGAMPLIGFLLARTFSGALEKADHWIAFALLAGIGVNMLREAGRERAADARENAFSEARMLSAAFATSVDALAVGVSLALSGRVNIFFAACVIALTTFAFCAAGVQIGNLLGMRFRKKAEIAGGCMLIYIGLRILAGHLAV